MHGPTVKPIPDFDAVADTERLRDIMIFPGGRDEGIINVLCHRSNAQRQEIATCYKSLGGNDLLYDLKSAIKGEFQELMVGLCQTPADFYAWELHKAIKALGMLRSGLRQDARKSHQYETCQMLATESHEQLCALFDAFEKTTGTSVDELIRKAFAGNDAGESLLVAVHAIRQPFTTFAHSIAGFYDSKMDVFGASSRQHDVIRTVVGRSEIDLGDILEKYESMYGAPFLGESNHHRARSYELALRILTRCPT